MSDAQSRIYRPEVRSETVGPHVIELSLGSGSGVILRRVDVPSGGIHNYRGPVYGVVNFADREGSGVDSDFMLGRLVEMMDEWRFGVILDDGAFEVLCDFAQRGFVWLGLSSDRALVRLSEPQSIEDDLQYEDHRTTFDVNEENPSSGVLRTGDDGCLYVERPEGGWPGFMGGTFVSRFYGRGFGYTVRGVSVRDSEGSGWVVLRYSTPADLRRARADEERKRNEEVDSRKHEADARIALLPEPLRRRIEFFRERDGDKFRHGAEDYELFIYEQAALFAAAFDEVEDLIEWSRLPDSEQHERIEFSRVHSGNTMHQSLLFARALIEDPAVLAPPEDGKMDPRIAIVAY